MSRKDEFKSVSSNPASKFLEWDSNSGSFKYYDKEAGQNKFVKAPFKFVVLKELHTIKGWHGASESGIYSNEVSALTDMLNVKSFKGGHIATGLYRDIKDKLQGGTYHKSLYVMLGDGSLANISMKGATVAKWGDFTQKCKNRLPDEWVAVTGYNDEKNGAVKYTTPKFEWKSSLTQQEGELADKAYEVMKDYLSGYFTKQNDEEAVQEAIESTPIANTSAHLEQPKNPYAGMKQEEMYHHSNASKADDYDELPF
jgi:hypothetical protein